MTRTSKFVAPGLSLGLLLGSAACVIKESPPPQQQPPAPQPTAAPAPTPAPTAATTTAAPAPTPLPGPTATPPPGGPTPMPTGLPTGFPAPGGTPGGTPAPGGAKPGLTLPGVCVPIGSWTKKFDNGLPASGTVDIGTPVLFNQFPVSDGVVVATMPAGTLKGTGAMTSTNDLSVDVTNGGYVLSYTCKFGNNCTEGTCTTTKGGLGGFKLQKK